MGITGGTANGSMQQMGMQGGGNGNAVQPSQIQQSLQSMMQLPSSSQISAAQQVPSSSQFTTPAATMMQTPISLQPYTGAGTSATAPFQVTAPSAPPMPQMPAAPAPQQQNPNMASTLPGSNASQSQLAQWWQQNQGKDVTTNPANPNQYSQPQQIAITGTAPNTGIWDNYLKNFGWSNTPLTGTANS